MANFIHNAEAPETHESKLHKISNELENLRIEVERREEEARHLATIIEASEKLKHAKNKYLAFKEYLNNESALGGSSIELM